MVCILNLIKSSLLVSAIFLFSAQVAISEERQGGTGLAPAKNSSERRARAREAWNDLELAEDGTQVRVPDRIPGVKLRDSNLIINSMIHLRIQIPAQNSRWPPEYPAGPVEAIIRRLGSRFNLQQHRTLWARRLLLDVYQAAIEKYREKLTQILTHASADTNRESRDEGFRRAHEMMENLTRVVDIAENIEKIERMKTDQHRKRENRAGGGAAVAGLLAAGFALATPADPVVCGTISGICAIVGGALAVVGIHESAMLTKWGNISGRAHELSGHLRDLGDLVQAHFDGEATAVAYLSGTLRAPGYASTAPAAPPWPMDQPIPAGLDTRDGGDNGGEDGTATIRYIDPTGLGNGYFVFEPAPAQAFAG